MRRIKKQKQGEGMWEEEMIDDEELPRFCCKSMVNIYCKVKENQPLLRETR